MAMLRETELPVGRDLPRGRLRQPRQLRAHLPRHRRRIAVALPRRHARAAGSRSVPGCWAMAATCPAPVSLRPLTDRAPPASNTAVSEKRGDPPRTSARSMFKRISHTFIYVLDQDQALDFYVGKLGMVVATDADLDEMRFLTVTLPGDPGLEVGLMLPGPPLHDEATAEQVRELVTKGAGGGGLIFETDDCVGNYERAARRRGRVHPGADRALLRDRTALRDPFGNSVRFTQRKPAGAGP